MKWITNERALKEGLPLREVLEKFIQAAVRLDERNGRVVSHHLECRGHTHIRMKYTGGRAPRAATEKMQRRFDAGIISAELETAGMAQQNQLWASIAKKSFCPRTGLSQPGNFIDRGPVTNLA